jgi:hypothetical protein
MNKKHEKFCTPGNVIASNILVLYEVVRANVQYESNNILISEYQYFKQPMLILIKFFFNKTNFSYWGMK